MKTRNFEKGLTVDQLNVIAYEEFRKLFDMEHFLNEDGKIEMQTLGLIERATFWHDTVEEVKKELNKVIEITEKPEIKKNLSRFIKRYLTDAKDSNLIIRGITNVNIQS